MKLIIFGLLFLILLGCCLGNKSFEGLINNSNTNNNSSNSSSVLEKQNNYTPATEIEEMGHQHLNPGVSGNQNNASKDGLESTSSHDNGYFIDNNAKNKNSYPSEYKSKKECDHAGYLWNEALKKCQENSSDKHNNANKYKTKSKCETAGYLWDSTKNICLEN